MHTQPSSPENHLRHLLRGLLSELENKRYLLLNLNQMHLLLVMQDYLELRPQLNLLTQELNTGINLVLADEVLGIKGGGALKAMEASCAGSLDEAACSKAFEAAVAAGTAVL